MDLKSTSTEMLMVLYPLPILRLDFPFAVEIFSFYEATTSVHLSETKLWLLTENDKEGIHVRIQMKYDKRFSWIKHKTQGEMEAGE